MKFYSIIFFSTFLVSAMHIDDVNRELAKYLTSNAHLGNAIKDIKALSLLNKQNNQLLNELTTIDVIVTLLSQQFDISKPCVSKLLKMPGCIYWFHQLELSKPTNINELFVEALMEDDSKLTFSLLNLGATIDIEVCSKPALIFLVTKKNHNMVRMLLKNGGNVDIQDEIGETPLICATKLNDVPMLNLLNEFGANKNIKAHDGYTAMDWAMFLS